MQPTLTLQRPDPLASSLISKHEYHLLERAYNAGTNSVSQLLTVCQLDCDDVSQAPGYTSRCNAALEHGDRDKSGLLHPPIEMFQKPL